MKTTSLQKQTMNKESNEELMAGRWTEKQHKITSKIIDLEVEMESIEIVTKTEMERILK